MPRRTIVLFVVVGLLAFAFASPGPGSPIRGSNPARRRQMLDSLRTLPREARRAALRQWMHRERPARQTSNGQAPGAPRKLDAHPNPFETDPIMPAPAIPEEGDNNQQVPAVAFDGTNYLVVWADDRGSGWHIYGALVPTTGTPDPAEEGFMISTSNCNPYFLPSVAFGAGYYLVAWQDDNYENVYGRLVNTLGERQGSSDIEICTYMGEGFLKWGTPSIAFDGTNFLVVWMDDQLDGTWWHLYGARVDPITGQVVPADVHGRLIWSNSNSSDQWNPSVAFDGTNYLVVWYDDRSADGIYGVMVSKSLTVQPDPGEITISVTSYYQDYPRVAFDGTNYLAVWQNANDDVLGARVRATNGYVVDQGDDVIPICADAGTEPYPDVAYGGGDFYFVVWQELNEIPPDDYSFDINGGEVSLGGVPAAYENLIAGEDYDEGLPAIACGPVEGKAMVVYQAVPGLFDEYDYGDLDRVLSRRAALTWDEDADLATDSIQRPVASFLMYGGGNPTWPIPPMAQLTNNGDEPRSFKATFTITNQADEEVYSETKTVLGLRPSTPRSEVFPPFDLDAEGAGLYTAKCSTRLADDGTKNNDSATACFQGCTFIDFFDLDSGDLTPDLSGNWDYAVPDTPPWTLPPMDATVWGNRLSGTYDEDEDTYLTSPEYTASQDDPSIAFQHMLLIDDPGDGGSVEYRIGNGSWTAIAPSAGEPYTGTNGYWTGSWSSWKQSVFTFTNVNNTNTFQVRWHLDADGDENVSYGWLIDEVAGIGCAVPPPAPPPGPAIDTLKVWPNLVRGTAKVNYTLRKDCNVSINLYDATGRLAARVPTNGFRKGPNTATLDASKLASGVYFVKLESATDTRTTKVIIE